MMSWQKTVFFIPGAGRILIAVRISVALTVATWVTIGPFPAFYPQEEALLYSPQMIAALLPPLGTALFNALKISVVLGCIGMLWPRTALAATRLTAVAFAVLNCYVAGFSTLWNYNTHLNMFLFAMSFAPGHNLSISPKLEERISAIVFFIRLQVAVIYLQAGLAKLAHGGLEWPFKAPYIHLVLQGSWALPWLKQWPTLVAVFGICVVVVELLLPILFMSSRTRLWAVLIATALHISFYVTLGIAFWHLWVLFPALFLIGSRPRGRLSVPASRQSQVSGNQVPCTTTPVT